MRPGPAAVLALLLGCSSTGTNAGSTDGGLDATASFSGSGLGEDATLDATEERLALPCTGLDAALAVASSDCVYAGTCPDDCISGTASAYLCVMGSDASLTYPAAFLPPYDNVDSVTIVGYEPAAYPWDGAAASLSCAALTCIRWEIADHVDGGSAWASDPCAPAEAGTPEAGTPVVDAGPFVTTQAWACPTLPGVMPPRSGCVAAGDIQRIGGPGTGIPVNAVWCCPPPAASEAGTPDDQGGANDASAG